MPSSSIAWPPFSNIVLPSTTLSFEARPTATPLVVSPTLMPPPPFSSSALRTTVFEFEPSSRMPWLDDPKISFASMRFESARSTHTAWPPFAARSLSLTTFDAALFVIQMPWSLMTTRLFRIVFESTFESYDAGGSGGCGSAGSTGKGRPSAIPASWLRWTVSSSTMFRVVPWFSMTP